VKATTYGVASFFCGLGGKTLGILRSRGRDGSRFESVGAFDLDADACLDFELLTGAKAQCVDLGRIRPDELAAKCSRRPDVVVMSPPCVGFSGCLAEGLSQTDRYQDLNMLAVRAINLALESWTTPPAIILLENVPRIRTRGAHMLGQIKALLRAADYEIDERDHDCGEIGGLAQSRTRYLLVARHRKLAPTPMLLPPNLGLRSMASVLWELPVPTPDSPAGGPMHKLPRLAPLNWGRLASIPAGRDWRWIPAAIRLPGDANRHAWKYGGQRDYQPAHTIIAEARTGNGWADVADPRLAPRAARQNGGFGVGDHDLPAHSVLGEGSVRNTFASVTDPRVGGDASDRQSGLYGVNDGGRWSHAVLGSARAGSSSWGAISDPRLGCSPHAGTMGVGNPSRASGTIIGAADIHNTSVAIADPRSECHRREGALGVQDPACAYTTSVIGSQQVHNAPSSVADPRLDHAPRRGTFGVPNPSRPSSTIRGEHSVRQAPAGVADPRELFRPTHELVAGPPLTATLDEWVNGEFWLVGPSVELASKGKPTHLIIRAPDGTVHRPLTTLELALLQGLPAWHRPGDPEELVLGAGGGQWLVLAGKKDSGWRKRIGNAVPVHTAQAIGAVMLEVLDAGATEIFRLSCGGIWVERAEMQASTS
jgi:site-specific DNA-cytosine methylase